MVNSETESLLIEAERVVTPYGVRRGLCLLISEGRIERIFESAKDATARHSQRTLTLEHLTLFPGFIDIHTHGALGVDMMTATPDDLQRVALFLAQHGVTGWLPTLVPAPYEDYRSAARALEQFISEQHERACAARVMGLHYEGPFVNDKQCGALRPAYFRGFKSAADLDALPVLHASQARHMMTVAPEIDGGLELVRELKRRGWTISIGHTRASEEVLDHAVEAGAHHVTHFFNAMTGLHHRAPGVVGWGLMRDDVTCDVIADGIHVDELVLRLLLRAKTHTRVALISDSVAPAGLGDGAFQLWGETIKVENGRTGNAGGHLAGSVINLNDAARRMNRLGLAPEEIARMAALNPARIIGCDSECGTIEEGKRADLVALDDEYRVRLTIVGGRIAFEK